VWDGRRKRAPSCRDRARQRGAALDEFAILVRAQFQTREFEERFIRSACPIASSAAFRFYERAEIRDALAYLRLVAQPADDLAFERIVNVPKRGLGDKAVEKIHRLARAEGTPLLTAASRILDSDELTPQARRALGNFVSSLARWRDMASALPHAELARILLDESGYTAMLQAEKTTEAAGRLENLSELARAMEDYETLGAFLEHVSLVMDNDAAEDERKGHDHDYPCRQGAGVRPCLPARMGGRRVPLAARARRGRAQERWRRSAASPMSPSRARGGAA
jgi:DNA helicase-2/ATP-dependent DNA helicase PcrA